MPQDYVKVAQTDQLPVGEKMLVELENELILLVNLEGNYHAVDGLCSHANARLSAGQLNGEEVECGFHGSVFNVKTGEALCLPAKESLAVYPVRVEGNDILVGPAEGQQS